MVLAVSLTELGQVLVIGLITGSIYSLMALGLVLIYRSSGVFNFAAGEFGTVAIYVASIALNMDLPYGVAVVLGLLAAVAVGLLTERFVIRPLFDAPRVTLLVATAGIALLALGVQFWRTQDNPLRFLSPLSETAARVNPLDIPISDQRIIAFIILIVVAAALYLFFKAPIGLAVLAASEEPVAAELVGVSVKRVSAMVWALAALVSGFAGLLLAGGASYGPGFMTAQALIPGFTAAVVGGLKSLPGAVFGGFTIAILQALGQLSTFDSVPGASSISVFLVLLLVLLIRPEGIFSRGAAA